MKRSIHAVFYFLPVKDGLKNTKLEVTFSVTCLPSYIWKPKFRILNKEINVLVYTDNEEEKEAAEHYKELLNDMPFKRVNTEFSNYRYSLAKPWTLNAMLSFTILQLNKIFGRLSQ